MNDVDEPKDKLSVMPKQISNDCRISIRFEAVIIIKDCEYSV